jgi:hypothetical protein
MSTYILCLHTIWMSTFWQSVIWVSTLWQLVSWMSTKKSSARKKCIGTELGSDVFRNKALSGYRTICITFFNVARFFLAKHTKKGKYTYTKWPQNVPNGLTIFQMAIKYTNIFHSKALQCKPKSVFFVWKYTIWQPCFCVITENRLL